MLVLYLLLIIFFIIQFCFIIKGQRQGIDHPPLRSSQGVRPPEGRQKGPLKQDKEDSPI